MSTENNGSIKNMFKRAKMARDYTGIGQEESAISLGISVGTLSRCMEPEFRHGDIVVIIIVFKLLKMRIKK